MGFYRENYKDTKQKKIIFGVVIVVVLMIVLFLIVKPAKEDKVKISFEERIAKVAEKENDFASIELSIPQIISFVKPLIVKIETFDEDNNSIGVGSGFFINSKGHIVSNLHVFKGAKRAKVKTYFGTYDVEKYLAFNKKSDIIKFRTKFKGPDFRRNKIKIGISNPKIGEKIVSVGNPLGLDLSASDGIVSAIREQKPFGTVIQITAPISPGSSGSPVINLKGEIVGIATFQMKQGQNLNFAIPISVVTKLRNEEELLLSKMDSSGSSAFKSLKTQMEQGEFLFNQNEFESAIPYFKNAVSENLQNAEAHFYLGICYRETGSTKAISEFKQAIDFDPGLKNVHYELGLIFMGMNMLDKSITEFQSEIDNNNHFNARVKLGSIYILKKWFEKARRMFESALEINESAEAYNFLGLACSALSKNMDAINAYDRALDLDNKNLDSYVGIIRIMIEAENWSQGLKYINEGMMENPNSFELHFLKGILALGNDDLITAKIELEILQNSKVKNKYKFINKLRNAINKYKMLKNRRY